MELIDRGAAIDAINEIIRMEHSLRPKVYVAKDAIKKLPSVQSTFDASDTQYNLPIGTDLISRQAAIDALRTCYDTETITMDNGDEYINYGDAVGEIEQLPPIQPAIIRCKDCKYARLTDDGSCKYCDIWFPDEAEYMDGDYYCASAERKSNG